MNLISFRGVGHAALMALLAAGVALAQSDNANVNGVITDPSGSAVPSAKVTLTNSATGLTRDTTSNESGVYSIPTVPPGVYTLVVEATGFKKFESSDNKIDPSVPANISARLAVGPSPRQWKSPPPPPSYKPNPAPSAR